MTDIFREVEEDVRRERFEKLWKQYGDYVFAGVAAIAIGVAGYKLWTRYETQQRESASKTYMAAQEAADSGNGPAAGAMFGKIAQSGPSGYASLAKLAEANTLMMTNHRSDGIALYKSIAEKDRGAVGNVARMRAAWAIADFAPKSEIQTLVAPLNVQTGAWRFLAQEVLAYSDYRSGATAQAEREYQALAKNDKAPQGVRQRANAMATFIKTGGERNFGAVPKPVQPAPPAPPAQP